MYAEIRFPAQDGPQPRGYAQSVILAIIDESPDRSGASPAWERKRRVALAPRNRSRDARLRRISLEAQTRARRGGIVSRSRRGGDSGGPTPSKHLPAADSRVFVLRRIAEVLSDYDLMPSSAVWRIA